MDSRDVSATLPIQGLTPEGLVRLVEGLPLGDARRIVSAVHRGRGLDAPLPNVRRSSLEAVRAVCSVPALRSVAVTASAVDPFVKYLFETADAHRIEAVRIPLEVRGRHTVCVSSQAGCALACRFCATGRLGLARNLETWEIVEQVRVVRLGLDPADGRRLHGVVFQGMGEPLASLDRVLAAIAVMTEPSALALDPRRMTICTVGLPSGIRRLAVEAPRVRLAISIGSADPATRRRLMPIEEVHSLEEVLAAAVEHAHATRLRSLWAYTLLSGVNDEPADARALARLANDFADRAGLAPRVTLIPYNAIDEPGADPFTRSPIEREWAFREALWDQGVYAHRRYSGGADVAAACGQLAGRVPTI